jgi:CBS domain-containing protein
LVEAIMKTYRVRRVPVVDSEKRLLGIVSLNDLALTAEHEKARAPRKSMDKLNVAETLAAVCEHRSAEKPEPALAEA